MKQKAVSTEATPRSCRSCRSRASGRRGGGRGPAVFMSHPASSRSSDRSSATGSTWTRHPARCRTVTACPSLPRRDRRLAASRSPSPAASRNRRINRARSRRPRSRSTVLSSRTACCGRVRCLRGRRRDPVTMVSARGRPDGRGSAAAERRSGHLGGAPAGDGKRFQWPPRCGGGSPRGSKSRCRRSKSWTRCAMRSGR